MEAEINFLPVCSNCKCILREVDWKAEEDITNPNAKLYYAKTHGIVPSHCPKCNTLFTRITMPTKLPFDTGDYVYGRN